MTPTPSITDEQLMAFADDELSGAEHDNIAAAVAADPALAERLAQQRRLREQLQRAFAGELDEPVPERLLQAVAPAAAPAPAPARAPVISLARHRAAVEAARTPAAPRARPGWVQWGGLAASIAIGVLIGHFGWPGGNAAHDGFALEAGKLVARGPLQASLSTQTAATPEPGAAVQLHFSFVDQAGRYCRTFSTSGNAGLACREGSDWAAQWLVDSPPGATPPGGMRQAGSALPAALLAEVDRRIDGPPLDAAAEQQALQRGWQR